MAIMTGTTKQLGGTEKTDPRQEIYYGLVQRNVLVTGAGGQLGSELAEQQNSRNLPFRFIFTDVGELDVTNREDVIAFTRDHAIRYIVHCAAYTAVDRAEDDADTAFLVNATAVENIAVAAKQIGAKVVHISTDFVFDGQSDKPYTEKIQPNPLSVYGRTKLCGEQLLQEVGGEWIILRTSWLYSSFGNNFVKTMMRLMHERDTLSIVDDQRGTPTYAADLAEMIVRILQFSEENEWKSGIYHFSNEGETTWFRFAEEIKRAAGISGCKLLPVTTHEYGAAAPRPAYSVMDHSRISATFQVKIPEWREALHRCLRLLK